MGAPQPSFRLIPSRFPPIGLFDTVATTADLEAVMELAGWTNDRLVVERLRRLPEREWVYGRPNASIVMAAFLHAAPAGGRFNGPELGAWYASAELATAVAEVGHHLRRELVARQQAEMTRTFRCYSAAIAGRYRDVSAEYRPELLAPHSHAESQVFGEAERAAGRDGLVYPSVRRRGGVNVVAFRPTRVDDVLQTDHFEVRVEAAARGIEARRLAG